ncbi:hypothetical protein CCP3SC1_2200003 [Gammaproteobacteria bacterium]
MDAATPLSLIAIGAGMHSYASIRFVARAESGHVQPKSPRFLGLLLAGVRLRIG